MAAIRNLNLAILEQGGRATAIVTYNLIGSEEDVQEQFRYLEIVELFGVDTRPGEDGVDDPIPNGRSFELLQFPVANPERRVVIQLRSSDVDEDRRPGDPFPLEDEIRARVTLRPAVGSAFFDSNIFRRGGQVGNIRVPVPA